jgi:circadian clock protein KaiB
MILPLKGWFKMSLSKGDAAERNEDMVLRLRLYITGSAPNSMRAQANLETICREFCPEHVNIEVIDVLQEPMRALEDKVLVTPTLRKLSPQPTAQIIGDLSDIDRVRLVLGIGGQMK